jgi:hypothetical protein
MDPTMMEDPNAAPIEQPKAMDREAPEPDENIQKHVAKWEKKVLAARKHHEDAFKRMTLDMEYAYKGCDTAKWQPDDMYTVPIIARYINQSVASLYAKNPRAVSKRKPRLEFRIWDGKFESLTAAIQSVQAAQAGPQVDPMTGQVMMPPPLDPNAQALIQDVQEGTMRKQMLERTGKTLEILFNYYTSEQEPNFKKQMKQLVRRTKICGVGYVTLGYQRILDKNPDVTTQIADAEKQIQVIERLSADVADGEIKEPDAKICELKNAIEALQAQETVLVREGLLFGFPRANEILPDPATRALNGWIGAGWIAEVFDKTPDEVKEIYKKDIGSSYTSYREGQMSKNVNTSTQSTDGGDDKALARLYRIWDKNTGTVFTICEGYKDYLDPPAPPKIKLERFFNVFALTFNDVEHEKEIFPPSDVYQLRHPQDEYNSARQGLKEHRQANRPLYVTPSGKLTEDDKNKVKNRKAHDILELNAIENLQEAGKLFQAVTHAGIDQNLYNTAPAMEDVLRTSGSQEANIGGTSGASATESSIAEASRSASLSSNVDDLDEFLSELARNSSAILLSELDPATVTDIVGPGASWPQLNREEIVKELYLDIKAGSSGRPNKTMELANMERAMPVLIQIPGVNPTPLGRKYCDLLDLDFDEMMVEGMPSIVAMNAMAGKQAQGATGDPSTDPNAQGAEGGNNAAKPAEGQPGAQPEYPGPQAGMSKIINYDMNGNPVA